MSNIDLVKDLCSLSTETQSKPWCLVRWHEGKMCGPVAPLAESLFLGYGFPSGYIGRIVRFDTQEEAQNAAASSAQGTKTAFDVPTLVDELRFSVFVYRYYDGEKIALRSDVLYEEAQMVFDIANGRVLGENKHASYKIWIDCTSFLGTPPVLQLSASK